MAVTYQQLGNDATTNNNFTLRSNGDGTLSLCKGTVASPTELVKIYSDGSVSPTTPRGHIFGLTLSNNVSDATNDIDIAAGEAASADTIPVPILLSSAMTKRIDASWAVGTNQGGLDTGSVSDGWYHVFLIKRPDTGVVDVLFSTSATAPTMPTNYTLKRRIGSVRRVSSAFVGFVQTGDKFMWSAAPYVDVNANNAGTSAVTRALSTPSGVVTEAILSVVIDAASGIYEQVYLSPLTITDIASSGNNSQGGGYSNHANGQMISGFVTVHTDTSSQIRSRLATGSASTTLRVITHGWYDTRGRIA